MGSLASFSQHLSDAVNLAAAANGVFPVSSISVLAGDVLLNAGTAGGYVAFNLFDSCDEKPAKKVLNPSFEALLNPALQKPDSVDEKLPGEVLNTEDLDSNSELLELLKLPIGPGLLPGDLDLGD